MAKLNPQSIGAVMPHGQAGSYARQPDMIINTRPAGGESPINFGLAVVYDENKNVVTYTYKNDIINQSGGASESG